MPETTSLLAFSLIALGMVLTPGPNMLYLISRSIGQGRAAGLISLGGVALGFVVYMLCAAFGITAIVMAVPYAYDALRFAGALYLLYLAWQAVKPGGRSLFQVNAPRPAADASGPPRGMRKLGAARRFLMKDLPQDSPRKLFMMGFLTNLLNPKIAIMYLSLLPQFISPEHGSVLAQSLILGFAQIVISLSVNASIVVAAGTIAAFLARRPAWLVVQRWLMATALAGIALRMATEARR